MTTSDLFNEWREDGADVLDTVPVLDLERHAERAHARTQLVHSSETADWRAFTADLEAAADERWASVADFTIDSVREDLAAGRPALIPCI